MYKLIQELEEYEVEQNKWMKHNEAMSCVGKVIRELNKHETAN